LEVGRLLEAVDFAALGVDPRHHMLDRAVLAGRVHRLQHDQDGVTVVGVEQLLSGGELLAALVKDRAGPLLADLLAQLLQLLGLPPPGGVVLDPNLPPAVDAETIDDNLRNHGNLDHRENGNSGPGPEPRRCRHAAGTVAVNPGRSLEGTASKLL